MVRHKSSSSSSSTGSSSQSSNGENPRTEILVNRSRRRRARPGVRALQEIRFYRKTTKLLIPKLPFSKLVRQIIYELFSEDDISRVQRAALKALQEAAEMYLVQFFEDSYLLSLHTKRVTLMRQDMILMRRLRGRDDVINK